MKVQIIPVNPFEMNCYIYYDESSKEGVIIDPAVYSDIEKSRITNFLSKEKIKIKFILNTHGHIDHILGNHWAKESLKVPVYIHKNDLELVQKAVEQGNLFGISFLEPPAPDKFIEENDEIKIDNCTLKIIHTPGHS
ncbi:MAG: MBL fold metallo-hydrolase, partial [Ignavibacteria bacterium]